MTKTTTEKRATMGGGFNTYTVTETDEWKGLPLGEELTEKHELLTVECDHYENEDADGIEIERGFWVKKSLVRRVFWRSDEATNCKVLARVEYARPL